MFKNISLEMSLKPFKQADDDYIKDVCTGLFEQWKPLLKDSEIVSILLWTSDGSEILDYKGNLSDELEWCHYIGGANPRDPWDKTSDPDGLGLHTRFYDYIPDPPKFTYGSLKNIVRIIKSTGKAVLGSKKIRVGGTFDPGPEFAMSDFKYVRHNEICLGESMGRKSMVCCYSTLNGDDVPYAGYPEGIEENTPFGLFFGRQCRLFLNDIDFDYLWLSNGFGFGTETWGVTGAVFNGTHFNAGKLDEIKNNILSFWKMFRIECPHYPVETRGTNLTTAIDLATDGVPLKDIYDGEFNILPPPNSPWAAINGDFGLELAGYMSKIAQLPLMDYMFRFYLHDPWWANSPWIDRYEGQPHDIYLPLSITRLDEKGKSQNPSNLSILTIDNSYGEMPDSCVYESLPHIKKAVSDAPDAPSPVVWIYPFNEYNQSRDEESLQDMFFEDWFIRGAINEGFPLSSVISTDNFISALSTNPDIFDSSVMVSVVPTKNSPYENSIMRFIEGGGRTIFYGNIRNAGNRFLDLIQVEFSDSLSEICSFDLLVEGDIIFPANDGNRSSQSSGFSGFPKEINHRSLLSGGPIKTRSKNSSSKMKVLGYANDKTIGTYCSQYAWVRGTNSSSFSSESPLLLPDDPLQFFPCEMLMRYALAQLGYAIYFQKDSPRIKNPVLMLSKKNGSLIFSSFSPDTTVKVFLHFPLGAPLLLGYETRIIDGYSTYTLPRSEHREIKAYIEQNDGIVSCREYPPVSFHMKRRILLTGLKNATVRFLAEYSCIKDMEVLLNSTYPHFIGEDFSSKIVEDKAENYFEACNITGSLLFSMPETQK